MSHGAIPSVYIIILSFRGFILLLALLTCCRGARAACVKIIPQWNGNVELLYRVIKGLLIVSHLHCDNSLYLLFRQTLKDFECLLTKCSVKQKRHYPPKAPGRNEHLHDKTSFWYFTINLESNLPSS